MRNATILLLTMIPFLWGFIPTVFVESAWVNTLYFRYVHVWEIAFILFWGWVGSYCGRAGQKAYKSILIGNATWLLSLGLYVWQFQLLDGTQRSAGILSLLPQLFPFGVLSTVFKMMTLFTRNITQNSGFILCYLYMLGIFLIGFYFGRMPRARQGSPAGTWQA